MPENRLPSPAEWGHAAGHAEPDEIVGNFACQTEMAINTYEALPEGPEPCNAKKGFSRVRVTIPLSRELFDSLMNSCSGYRAHYAVSIEFGEAFNQKIVNAIVPLIVNAEKLYADKFNRDLCHRSLCGRFTKLWFGKEVSDLSDDEFSERYEETLMFSRWQEFWQAKPKPWKGLAAPIPESRGLLLNGTFVCDSGGDYEQKPGRSREIYECGWT